jgi:hypothetical protein
MVTLFVRHAVNDYDQWKKGYDAFGPQRKTMGIVAASVHRDVIKPNVVVIVHRFTSLAHATAFIESSELRQAMSDAGVNAAPEVWATVDAESTAH